MPEPLFTVTVVYDDRSNRDDLLPSHGFSCLIETNQGQKLLFDTGESGPLLIANMERLDFDPGLIELVVLSHEDYDHIGGLTSLMSIQKSLKVFIPQSFSTDFHKKIHGLPGDVRQVSEGVQLLPGLYTTGEIQGTINEQGLVLTGQEKSLFIGGCCHPGLNTMVAAAGTIVGQPVGGIMGGFHLCHSEYEDIETQLQDLKKLGVEIIIPCHCTGFTGTEIAQTVFGSHYIDCGLGTRVEWF